MPPLVPAVWFTAGVPPTNVVVIGACVEVVTVVPLPPATCVVVEVSMFVAVVTTVVFAAVLAAVCDTDVVPGCDTVVVPGCGTIGVFVVTAGLAVVVVV